MKVSGCTNIATHYTPSIEDIFVGYEAEFNWCTSGGFVTFNDDNTPDIMIEPTTKQWETIRCGYPQTMMDSSRTPADFYSILKNGHLRTPYLTKEQLEKEGWIYSPDTFLIETLKKEPTHFWFTKNGYGLMFYPNEDNLIDITDDRKHTAIAVTLFTGKCPSINEFRTIMKLLNIK